MLRPYVATQAVTVGRPGLADDENEMEGRLDGNGLWTPPSEWQLRLKRTAGNVNAAREL